LRVSELTFSFYCFSFSCSITFPELFQNFNLIEIISSEIFIRNYVEVDRQKHGQNDNESLTWVYLPITWAKVETLHFNYWFLQQKHTRYERQAICLMVVYLDHDKAVFKMFCASQIESWTKTVGFENILGSYGDKWISVCKLSRNQSVVKCWKRNRLIVLNSTLLIHLFISDSLRRLKRNCLHEGT